MDAAVIEILQQAGSQDPNILKPAEETLKQWETEKGFYIALYVSFINLYIKVHCWNKRHNDLTCNNCFRIYFLIIP